MRFMWMSPWLSPCQENTPDSCWYESVSILKGKSTLHHREQKNWLVITPNSVKWWTTGFSHQLLKEKHLLWCHWSGCGHKSDPQQSISVVCHSLLNISLTHRVFTLLCLYTVTELRKIGSSIRSLPHDGCIVFFWVEDEFLKTLSSISVRTFAEKSILFSTIKPTATSTDSVTSQGRLQYVREKPTD